VSPRDAAEGIRFRDMTEADLAGGLSLSRASGWNQTLDDWRLLLELGQGLFRVGTRDDALVASGGAVRYGEALAWICMILVRPDERGRGLGTRVFADVVGRLRALREAGRLRTVGLDATPAGRALYLQHGFIDRSALVRLVREPDTPLVSGPRWSRPLEAHDVELVLERDRAVFGADRAAVLRALFSSAPDLAGVVRDGDRLEAYGLGRHGDHADHVGPIVADNPALALELVRAIAEQPRGRPLILDARGDPRWLEGLRELGFRALRPLTRMYLGAPPAAGQPDLEPAILGPEFG
jgi:GNAT superfamily N-acetyltransferase